MHQQLEQMRSSLRNTRDQVARIDEQAQHTFANLDGRVRSLESEHHLQTQAVYGYGVPPRPPTFATQVVCPAPSMPYERVVKPRLAEPGMRLASDSTNGTEMEISTPITDSEKVREEVDTPESVPPPTINNPLDIAHYRQWSGDILQENFRMQCMSYALAFV